MTGVRSSQFANISINGGTAGGNRASQFAMISLAAPLANTRAMQFALITLVANGENYQPLGPAIQLGCWTPCANLAFNGE